MYLQRAFVLLTIITQPKLYKCSHDDQGSNYYFEHWCNQHHLKYLDDSKCAKIFPSSYDTDFRCPGSISSLEDLPPGYVEDQPFSTEIPIDISTLPALGLDPATRACLVLTRRVQKHDSFHLYNKYLCNGADSRDGAHETWSSSKIYAVAQAAGNLRSNRSESNCGPQLGLTGSVDGMHGRTLLGDLATIITSYDETMNYSSNSLAGWFNGIALRARENALVQDWLGSVSPLSEPQSLGGNYGEPEPPDIAGPPVILSSNSLNVQEMGSNSLRKTQQCTLASDTSGIYANSLSALSQAELVRRLVQHRDLQPDLQFPGVRWADIQQLLYGAGGIRGSLFPGQRWGGMTADTAIFVQSALNMSAVQKMSQGNWRIFSKLGAGYSTSREVGEIVTTASACVPLASPREGEQEREQAYVEFSLSVRGSAPNDPSLERAQKLVWDAVRLLVEGVTAGEIDKI